ncbi:MAG: hypothetical protein L0210_15535 [Rhodospirillales bacterium]|nr:hypothetical protein [Rhodospirillales bacterium]
MTDAELSRALGRLEGRLDAFERTRIERDQALDRQLAAISGKLDRLNTAFNMGRGGALALVKLGGLLLLLAAAAAWLADRLPAWLR